MELEFYPVADAGTILAGECRAFELGGLRIVVAHLADGYYAVEDRCSHADSRLDAGRIYHGRQVACPMHGARFDLKTGAAKSPPAFRPLAAFATRIMNGKVEVALPAAPADTPAR